MEFNWLWLVAGVAALWVFGWLASTAFIFLFNPLVSAEDKKDWRNHLQGLLFINAVLWPVMFPAVWRRYWFYRDMRLGKRPKWVLLSDGETSSTGMTLPDGNEVYASVNGGTGTDQSSVTVACSAQPVAEVEYRLRMKAPTPAAPTEWQPLTLQPPGKGSEFDEEDEDDDDDGMQFVFTRNVTVLPGKYDVSFRLRDASGTLYELAVTMIVWRDEDVAAI